jgi:hypothetical protein
MMRASRDKATSKIVTIDDAASTDAGSFSGLINRLAYTKEHPTLIEPVAAVGKVARGGPPRLHGSCDSLSRRAVPGFDGLDGLFQHLSQDAFAEDPEHEPEHPSLDVLAVAHHDGVGRSSHRADA